MYITDLKHFLDSRGAIGPNKGPARAMAQFQTDVVAFSTNTAGSALDAPTCFKCRKIAVQAVLARDDAVVWKCPRCETEGRISNWQGTLWDLRDRPAAPA
jgi:ribosomal protein L37AE/L43A